MKAILITALLMLAAPALANNATYCRSHGCDAPETCPDPPPCVTTIPPAVSCPAPTIVIKARVLRCQKTKTLTNGRIVGTRCLLVVEGTTI